MSDTPFEKLTMMWRSAEITDDEFRLATRYLREEQAKLEAPDKHERSTADGNLAKPRSLSSRLAELLLPRTFLAKLPRWQRHLSEIGLFSVVAGIGVWLISYLTYLVLLADIEGSWNLNPVGAAGLTLVVLATGGVLVGYNRRILSVISVPLFLLLLFSPLSKSDDVSSGASLRHSVPVYEQPVSVSDYGTGWPYPEYTSGILRCERTSISGVKRSLVTIELGGLKYGLNGAASGWGGYTDSRTLMKKHPQWDTYELGASDLMRSMALNNCEAQG